MLYLTILEALNTTKYFWGKTVNPVFCMRINYIPCQRAHAEFVASYSEVLHRPNYMLCPNRCLNLLVSTPPLPLSPSLRMSLLRPGVIKQHKPIPSPSLPPIIQHTLCLDSLVYAVSGSPSYIWNLCSLEYVLSLDET